MQYGYVMSGQPRVRWKRVAAFVIAVVGIDTVSSRTAPLWPAEEFERVLVMVTFWFCSAVQPISVSEGARFSKPRATPWGTMSQYERGRPNGPMVLPSVPELGGAADDDRSPWPQATQVAYQRNRLARWAEKRSVWAYGAPGRCPWLAEPRAFGPGTYFGVRHFSAALALANPCKRSARRRVGRPFSARPKRR